MPRAGAARSVRVFGIYLVGLGAVLLIAPNALLVPFGIPVTHEVWIRVLGVLVVNMGVNYVHAARTGARAHLWATVGTRVFVFVAFTAFVWLGHSTIGLVGFGAVDLLGAIWTAWELRREARGAA